MKLLVTVKTYPNPSVRYQETVCTAGIDLEGNWIRLYPVSFRYLPRPQQYKKYQWINVDATKNEADPRPESYRPVLDSIQPLSFVDTKEKWQKRKELVLRKNVFGSVEELQAAWDQDRTSLGTIKPLEILDFMIEESESEWSSKHKVVLDQGRLFSGAKELEKVPLDFKYRFRCHESYCKGHVMTIIDWEILEAYRTWRRTYGTRKALEHIKNKWMNELWNSKRDSYLFLGSHHPYRTFMVLGIFWPPK